MVRIRLEQVNKIFNPDVHVLKDLSLEIKDKEFMVLVGPSGCGKSTCLNIIAGLEYVTDGRVLFDDVDVTYIPPKERKVAMVFQSYALYPHMNVRKNMGFALKLSKMDKNEINRKVEAAAELLEISELLERKPKELSGGQRQRVAIARALVTDPSIILADEPTGNLDSKSGEEIMTIFDSLHDAGNTIILVTHERYIAEHANRTIRLLDGKIQIDEQNHKK